MNLPDGILCTSALYDKGRSFLGQNLRTLKEDPSGLRAASAPDSTDRRATGPKGVSDREYFR